MVQEQQNRDEQRADWQMMTMVMMWMVNQNSRQNNTTTNPILNQMMANVNQNSSQNNGTTNPLNQMMANVNHEAPATATAVSTAATEPAHDDVDKDDSSKEN